MLRIILSPDRVEGFRRAVRDFFRVQGRSFPWRETCDPYAVMVSEFMLQQTQTARVTEKYAAWLERFPTVRSVAQAELSDVLSLWNGLGYNRRAKFLHEACKRICTEYGGIIPDDAETLDAIPGIGVYTARAICAFAFGKAEVFVETNIRAVFIHCFFAGGAADGTCGERSPAYEAGDALRAGFRRGGIREPDHDHTLQKRAHGRTVSDPRNGMPLRLRRLEDLRETVERAIEAAANPHSVKHLPKSA